MLKSVNKLVVRAIIEFLVLAAVLSAIGYLVYTKIDSMLKASLEESVALQANSIAVGLRNQFNEKFHKLQAAAYIAETGQVSIDNITDVFMVHTKGEALGIITKDNEAILGWPIPKILMKDFAKVFEGERAVRYHNSLGLIFAVPVKVEGQTCMMYNTISNEAVRRIFHAVSYNGAGTVILLNTFYDWMVINDGEELINTQARMMPNWRKLRDKIVADEEAGLGTSSWSTYGEYKDKGYFLYVAWVSKAHNFQISGYAPWKAVAVGIDYIYMIMIVTFGVILLLLLVGVRYMMKTRQAEGLEREKVLANSANKAKSEFLSNMSHEIRTPINAIMGMDEMILRESKEPATLEYANNLQNAAKSLLSLINDILDFSKIEAGKMEIIPVEYHLASVLNDLVNMIQKRAEKKGLELKIEADKSLPSVLFGDEVRIKQVITNILTNAVKYTETGSVTLKVTWRSAEDFSSLPAHPPSLEKSSNNICLCVSVTDTGIGIKEEDLKKLFSAFERIEEERNRNIEGTGLGMNITKQLLTMMGSQLKVDSIYGEGSTFSFEIEQRVMNPEPIGDFEESYKRSLSHRSEYHESFVAPEAEILVVDDTVMNLTVVKGLLKQTRIKIDTAISGPECLKLVAQKKYDIIFLDHRMPGMDGIETLEKMEEMAESLNKETPVISLTANAISGAREQYIAAGFSDYLTKPINAAALEKMIVKYLPPEKIGDNRLSDSGGRAGPQKNKEEPTSPQEKEEAQLPEWLTNVSGLNIKEGIEHCGGAEAYLDVLKVFAESITTAASDIEDYFNAQDWKNYTTKVHALKSTAKVVGAEELSERARRMEDAGNSGYFEEIQQDTKPLLELYRSYTEKLTPLVAGQAAGGSPDDGGNRLSDSGGRVGPQEKEKPLIDDAELQEAFEAMKDIAATFDYDSLMFVIKSLEEYRLPESEAERYKQIREAAAKLDWTKINELLDKQ